MVIRERFTPLSTFINKKKCRERSEIVVAVRGTNQKSEMGKKWLTRLRAEHGADEQDRPPCLLLNVDKVDTTLANNKSG